MAGFLDQYGAGDDRREKIIKWIVFSVLGVILIGGPLIFVFYDFRQEGQVKKFFHLLESHEYRAAYALWGCTDTQPCTGYSMSSFLDDWGPAKDTANMRITRSRSCGSGVIITVNFDRNRQERLWVERSNLTIGFSPFPGCPR